MKLRTILIAAVLWGQDALPEELIDNLDFFISIDVNEAAAADDFFDVMLSTSTEADSLLEEDEDSETDEDDEDDEEEEPS